MNPNHGKDFFFVATKEEAVQRLKETQEQSRSASGNKERGGGNSAIFGRSGGLSSKGTPKTGKIPLTFCWLLLSTDKKVDIFFHSQAFSSFLLFSL